MGFHRFDDTGGVVSLYDASAGGGSKETATATKINKQQQTKSMTKDLVLDK